MATQRLLDVWLLDGNTVYKAVPFTVIADWLQQGRLLPEDRVRIAGGNKWLPITEVGAFEPYLPRPEPMEAEDTAEALEPVDLGLEFAAKKADEEDDVDMIPLIDISLVLLIFFMMTASVSSGIMSPINTPPAKHQLAEISQDMLWVGVDSKSLAGTVQKDKDGKELPWFSFGDDKETYLKPTPNQQDLQNIMRQKLEALDGVAKIRIRADLNLPIETIQQMQLELQGLQRSMNASRPAGKGPLTFTIYGEVSEPKE
jgi:biopolymer transport protein ExbD